MMLDERTMRLIAVGASITANCQPCLQTNAIKARENGATELEIAEAIWVGALVRQGAAAKMDMFASRLNEAAHLPVNVPNDGCECT